MEITFIARYWAHGDEKPIKLFQATAHNEEEVRYIEERFRKEINSRLCNEHRIEWVFSQWRYIMRFCGAGYDIYLTAYNDFTPGINDY